MSILGYDLRRDAIELLHEHVHRGEGEAGEEHVADPAAEQARARMGVVGGAMQQIARIALPAGAAKEFLTSGVSPSIGPFPIDLVIVKFVLGPVALDVSFLSLVGVLVAYLIARSLF